MIVVPGDLLSSKDDYAIGVGVYCLESKSELRSSVIGSVVYDFDSTSNKKRINVIPKQPSSVVQIDGKYSDGMNIEVEEGNGGDEMDLMALGAQRLPPMIEVNQVVLCKVKKVQQSQVVMDIVGIVHHIDDKEKEDSTKMDEEQQERRQSLQLSSITRLPSYSHVRGVLKKEDVLPKETDSLLLYHQFRPNDLVVAKIISMGDARQFYLSTSGAVFGVIHAKAKNSNNAVSSQSNNRNEMTNMMGESVFLVPIDASSMRNLVTNEIEKRKVALPFK